MNIFRLYRTLIDIGIYRNLVRIFHEFRQIIYKILPRKILILLVDFGQNNYSWNNTLSEFNSLNLLEIILVDETELIEFDFIGIKKRLEFPFAWNNKDWPRLWQFNLHYFDWARKLLEKSLKENKIEKNLKLIGKIIDHWIEYNYIAQGDGWNSYTLSLRIRNWIWLFRVCPNLVNKKRIDSLWKQICWLNSHLEIYYGGNHLIENLITLIIGSLQFKSNKSNKIFIRSLKLLKQELDKQILSDGGHEERTAGYHFLILERLVELGCVLKTNNKEKKWLDLKIKQMNLWSKKVLLFNDQIPSYNDSNLSLISSPKEIILFADAYLNKSFYKLKGIKSLMIKACRFKLSSMKKSKSNFLNKYITDLKDTGWTLLRPGYGWEITFKWGIPCPKHLPAHAQSDLLSINIYQYGKPILIDAGTSTYENNYLRSYERSCSAHNCLQLGKKNLLGSYWIEPIEIWSSFRAGFKASPIKHFCRNKNDTISSFGSHDGYLRYGAKCSREVLCRVNEDKSLIITIIDLVSSKKKMFWRQFWHFGQGDFDQIGNNIISQFAKKQSFKYDWKTSNYSLNFGKYLKRKTLTNQGIINPGNNRIKKELIFENQFI